MTKQKDEDHHGKLIPLSIMAFHLQLTLVKNTTVIGNQSGEALAEYALLTFLMLASISGVFVTFNQYLHEYFNVVTSIVALPIP